jgi:hypothetical protein
MKNRNHMRTPLDGIVDLVAAEESHSRAINNCFIYFAALAETKHRGCVSDLFECLPPHLPTECNDVTALRVHRTIIEFIEKCSSHPNVGSCFRTLLHLNASDNLQDYLIDKLKFYYAQGNAHNVFQICIVLTDMGMDIFRDENGKFMLSRSSCAAEINMGVARRFLERLNQQQS